MITRRKLLALLAVGPAAASVAPGMAWAETADAAGRMPAGFARERFRALLRSRFSIVHGLFDRSEVTLIEVADGPVSPRTEQFSITFKGPGSRPLPEGLYDLRHSRMGPFQLHLQPVGADHRGAYYRAAFNLSV